MLFEILQVYGFLCSRDECLELAVVKHPQPLQVDDISQALTECIHMLTDLQQERKNKM